MDPDTSRTAAKAVLTRYDETGEPPLPSKRKSNQKNKSKPKTNENNTPIVVSPGKPRFRARPILTKKKCARTVQPGFIR